MSENRVGNNSIPFSLLLALFLVLICIKKTEVEFIRQLYLMRSFAFSPSARSASISLSIITCSMASVVDLLINFLDHPLLSNISFSSQKSAYFWLQKKSKACQTKDASAQMHFFSGDTPLPFAFKTENQCV